MINWCLPVLCAVFLWHLGASSETRNTLRLGKPKGETPCRDFYAKEIVCNKNITEILYDVLFFLRQPLFNGTILLNISSGTRLIYPNHVGIYSPL